MKKTYSLLTELKLNVLWILYCFGWNKMSNYHTQVWASVTFEVLCIILIKDM